MMFVKVTDQINNKKWEYHVNVKEIKSFGVLDGQYHVVLYDDEKSYLRPVHLISKKDYKRLAKL